MSSPSPSPKTLAGVFSSPERAEDAVARLCRAGFPVDSISIVAPERDATRFERLWEPPAGQRAGTRAVTGAALGGAVGAAATGAAGLFVAGPLFAGALAGAAAGGFLGAMSTRAEQSPARDQFDQAVRRDRILVAVEPQFDEQRSAARAALDEAGAEPIELS